MKKFVSNLLLVLILFILIGCEGKHSNEWVVKNDIKYYYDATGARVKDDIVEIDGEKYYFDEKCEMKTGLVDFEGNKYYFDKKGRLSKGGWVENNGNTYLVDNNGMVLTGWQQIDNDWYFMNKDGVRMSGVVDDEGVKYYLYEDGKLSKGGWTKYNGDYYLINVNGTVVTGWYQEGVDFYYMDEYGKMQSSTWIGSGNEKFYVDEQGKMLINTQKKIGTDNYAFDERGFARKIKNLWSISHYVDKFGDPTKEQVVINYPYFSGKFSNSATTNSKCSYKFLIDDGDVTMMMYEYDSYQVKGEYFFDCSIKMDSGYTINFSGRIYSEGDRVYFDYTGKTAIINCLKGSENFKLYLTESASYYGVPSTYLVEVEPDNFKYVWWK